MRILMILDREFPTDHRVEKEAKSLIAVGHEIILLCYSFGKDIKKEENYKGIAIRRFKLKKSIRDKLIALYLIIPLYKWFWKKQIKKIINKEKIEAIHIHDLPLSDIGVKMKNKYKVKLICDQHEYYSNWIVHNAHLNTFIGKIVKKLSNWKKYEKKYLNRADLVVTVEEPLRQEYIKHVGIDPDKIINVPNTPLERFVNSTINEKILQQYRDKFVLFYMGGISDLRGITTAIRALPFIKDVIPEIKLVLAGKIRKYSNPVKLAEDIGMAEFIDFLGWVDYYDLPSYIKASDACFHIPPVLREETNKTIATKIYQYLAIGKPIICSEAEMMKNFVTDNQVGMVIRQDDAIDFAEKIIKLYEDKSLRRKFEENCQKIASRYLWENTSKELIEKYNKLQNDA